MQQDQCTNNNFISIERKIVEKLIRAHDGDMALLYLYGLIEDRSCTEAAAEALCRTGSEINAAAEKLQRICPEGSPAPARPVPAAAPSAGRTTAPPSQPTGFSDPDALPEYSTDYIAGRAERGSPFSFIIEEAKKVFGRPLSTPEMQTLLGINEYLGLPAEVVMMLLNYCAELCSEQSGGKRRPTAKSVQKEASFWARNEIDTLEKAEEFIARHRDMRAGTARVMEVLGLGGRKPIAKEQQLISSWLSAGFGIDAISIAYERTMLNTGKVSWNYMDRIIQSWKEKKLFTAEEINEKDVRSAPQNFQHKPSGTATAVNIDELKKMLDKV